MLGTLNESHIIRTIEYWDVERRKYPSLTHYAVIVAENITNKINNVIGLMNKSIPIIGIQLNAFVFENNLFLNFVKVLDLVETFEDDQEEDNQDPVDRAYWVTRSNEKVHATCRFYWNILQHFYCESPITEGILPSAQRGIISCGVILAKSPTFT